MSFNRNKNVKVTTAHLPYKSKKKLWITILVSAITIGLILFFPEEIGRFIGKWVFEFIKGFKGVII